MKLRASSAPLYTACPAAAYGQDDPISINPNDPAGAVGSAVHKALALFVSNKSVEMNSIADEFGLDKAQAKDMQILYAVGRKWWRKFGEQFGPNPKCEYELLAVDSASLCGHVDVMGQDSHVVRVMDWKTTRLESVNYQPQMLQYLYLAWAAPQGPVWDGDVTYQYITVYLRDQTQDVSPLYTPQDLQAWHDAYIEKVTNWDGRTYCPGGNCTFCPRQVCCPALERQLARTYTSLNYDGQSDTEAYIEVLNDVSCVNLYEAIRLAEKQLAGAIEILKLRAGASENGLQGESKALVLREQHRDTIKAKEAWPIILDVLTEAEIAPCVTIRKNSLLDAVGAKTPRGQKKVVKDALMARLEEAGAVETSSFKVPALVPVETKVVTSEIKGDTINDTEQ